MAAIGAIGCKGGNNDGVIGYYNKTSCSCFKFLDRSYNYKGFSLLLFKN